MSAARSRLPYAFARRAGLLDMGGEADVRVAMREGADPMALVEARRALRGARLAVETMPAGEFDRRLADAYAGAGIDAGAADELGRSGALGDIDGLPPVADLLEARDDAPVIRLINGLMAEAARIGASDIHMEPYDTELVIRMRVDGVMSATARLPARLAPVLVSRVKVMSRLDIAERRVPQDGRISLNIGGRALDVRVSTLPAKAGERVVLRLLDRDRAGLQLDDLGMPDEIAGAFRAALNEPNGIVLVTGPTGAGKTTTLYAGLRLLNDASRTILTIEDPIEYAIDGIGQTQVNAKVGMTFAAGLRAILRQNPNVVMVGEIRDAETAQIAVQASLTGHLVLSTLHTNDAIGAVTRLRDIGIEPFLIASTLRGVIAQRLVRRLCPACRRAETVDASGADLAGLPVGAVIHRAVGCPQCGGTGYAGRLGLFELVRSDEGLRRLISANAPEADLAAHAFANAPQLAQSAREAVLRGETTIEEALRVIRPEGGRHADL
jgi:general secretion pathway protein E